MDKKRLNMLFLMVFMFSLFMLWDAWQKSHQPPPAPAQASSVPGAPASAVTAAGVPTVTATPAATIPADNVPKATVKTDLFTAEISAQGGDLVGLILDKHRATNDATKN
ncbi:MAG TPA: membrane protein insertase YidC, partial [Rhodocyclaceae bacterium]|nr:membrane protein insertase YidC [Rhodocyclaceae bacterium]